MQRKAASFSSRFHFKNLSRLNVFTQPGFVFLHRRLGVTSQRWRHGTEKLIQPHWRQVVKTYGIKSQYFVFTNFGNNRKPTSSQRQVCSPVVCLYHKHLTAEDCWWHTTILPLFLTYCNNNASIMFSFPVFFLFSNCIITIVPSSPWPGTTY